MNVSVHRQVYSAFLLVCCEGKLHQPLILGHTGEIPTLSLIDRH